jgi:phosphoenolpyruvate carboxylase
MVCMLLCRLFSLQGAAGPVEMVIAKADSRVTAMYDAKLVRPELQVRVMHQVSTEAPVSSC